jgi:type IV pilus biogenesis protein PilP
MRFNKVMASIFLALNVACMPVLADVGVTTNEGLAGEAPISNDEYSRSKEALLKRTELSKNRLEYLQNQALIIEAENKLKELEEKNKNSEEPNKVKDSGVLSEIEALKKEKAPEQPKLVQKEKTPSEVALDALSDIYLTSIYSVGNSTNAVIMYRGGTTKAKVGSDLPGGWKVASIDGSYLSVKHKDVEGVKQISFKAPSIIASEMSLKQEVEFTRIKNEVELEKMKMQNEILPLVTK